jgi:hypothetical protein
VPPGNTSITPQTETFLFSIFKWALLWNPTGDVVMRDATCNIADMRVAYMHGLKAEGTAGDVFTGYVGTPRVGTGGAKIQDPV